MGFFKWNGELIEPSFQFCESIATNETLQEAFAGTVNEGQALLPGLRDGARIKIKGFRLDGDT